MTTTGADPVGADGRFLVAVPAPAAGQHTAVVTVGDGAGQTVSFGVPELPTLSAVPNDFGGATDQMLIFDLTVEDDPGSA